MVSSVSSSSPTQIFSSSIAIGTAPVLRSLLKKPRKVLTVGVEYSPQQSDDLAEEDRGSLDVLSMKLRQQAKVSFIVCSDILAIKLLIAEQEAAKGNFPGPIPIVCEGESTHLSMMWEDLSDAGASAVAVDAGLTDAISVADSASSNGLEIIWKVSTVKEAEQVLEATDEQADIFLLDIHAGDDPEETLIPKIIEVLPKSSLPIAVLHNHMQEDGAEIEMGKEFKSMGCGSILIRKACVGDKEDIDYASFERTHQQGL